MVKDGKKRTQTLKDGTVLTSEGSESYDGKDWLEHYVLNENQKNMIVNYADDTQLKNAGYDPSNYEYAGVYVTSGTWKSSKSDLSELDPKEKSYEVANDDSQNAIKVTFYYRLKIKDEKSQYVYIKHAITDSKGKTVGANISGLSGSESFSTGFKENDLTKLTDTKGYQTAYKFKADGIANGGIYRSSKITTRR